MLVSVIVPVYNVAKYLGECLESIIGQSYKRLEIIAVNDGSTDESGEILEAYARRDARITVVRQENGGLSSARNTGLELMKGDLLMFVDSDDVLEQEAVERCVEVFAQDEDVRMIKYSYRELGGQNDEKLRYCPKGLRGKLHSDKFFALLLDKKLSLSVWSAMYRSDFVRSLRFRVGVYAEDLEYMIQLFGLDAFYLYFLPEPLYRYRINPEGISKAKYKPMWRDAFGIWVEGVQSMWEINPKKARRLSYGLFRHASSFDKEAMREPNLSPEEHKELRELLAPVFATLEVCPIAWSYGSRTLDYRLYWHCPRLWHLLHPKYNRAFSLRP